MYLGRSSIYNIYSLSEDGTEIVDMPKEFIYYFILDFIGDRSIVSKEISSMVLENCDAFCGQDVQHNPSKLDHPLVPPILYNP